MRDVVKEYMDEIATAIEKSSERFLFENNNEQTRALLVNAMKESVISLSQRYGFIIDVDRLGVDHDEEAALRSVLYFNKYTSDVMRKLLTRQDLLYIW